MPVLKQTSPTGAGVGGMSAEAAPPEHRSVAQNQGGGRTGRYRVATGRDSFRARRRRSSGQVGQRETSGGNHRRPVARRNGPGLAPFADRLGPDAGQPRSGFGAAQPFDESIHIDGHAAHSMGRKFPTQQPGDVVGNFLRRITALSLRI